MEQIPQYHHPKHLQEYDVESPQREWGELSILMEMLDAIVHEGSPNIHPREARAREGLFESRFSHQYPRSEVSASGESYAPEFMTLSVDYAHYLGSSALKQCYKVRLDSSVRHQQLSTNRITTLYCLEERAGTGNVYSGSMLRPNIIGDPDVSDEQMAVYDCNQLARILDEVMDLIQEDIKHHSSNI